MLVDLAIGHILVRKADRPGGPGSAEDHPEVPDLTAKTCEKASCRAADWTWLPFLRTAEQLDERREHI